MPCPKHRACIHIHQVNLCSYAVVYPPTRPLYIADHGPDRYLPISYHDSYPLESVVRLRQRERHFACIVCSAATLHNRSDWHRMSSSRVCSLRGGGVQTGSQSSSCPRKCALSLLQVIVLPPAHWLAGFSSAFSPGNERVTSVKKRGSKATRGADLRWMYGGTKDAGWCYSFSSPDSCCAAVARSQKAMCIPVWFDRPPARLPRRDTVPLLRN